MSMAQGASLDEIEKVYRGMRRQLLRLAAAITMDSESSADAVHDAFVACVRARDAFRGDGPIEGWITRAVINSALKIVRNGGGMDALPDESAEPDVAEPFQSQDVVRAAIGRLPERERLILFLSYYTDMDYRSIGKTLNIAPGTVGAALHSARRALRQRLEEAVRESA